MYNKEHCPHYFGIGLYRIFVWISFENVSEYVPFIMWDFYG